MSPDTLPIALDSLPVVARTDMRDVRLVSVTAHSLDVVPRDTDIEIHMAPPRYRTEDGFLFVRAKAEARYLEQVTKTDAVSDGPTDATSEERREVGRIEVELLAELDFQGGEITSAQMDEFADHNLLFMIFPYVRTVLQQMAADLRLPPTVMPYLRRDVLVSTSMAAEEDEPE